MLNLVQVQASLQNPIVTNQDLMKYANGSNPDVPSYMALGELNRRKQLEALAQPTPQQQPTVKQQVEQGLGSLAQANPVAPLQGANPTLAQAGVNPIAQQSGTNPVASSGMIDPTQLLQQGPQEAYAQMKQVRGSGNNPQTGVPQAPGNPQLPQAPATPMAHGGLASMPLHHMFHHDNFAGGGIVAFDEGGETEDTTSDSKAVGPDGLTADERLANANALASLEAGPATQGIQVAQAPLLPPDKLDLNQYSYRNPPETYGGLHDNSMDVLREAGNYIDSLFDRISPSAGELRKKNERRLQGVPSNQSVVSAHPTQIINTAANTGQPTQGGFEASTPVAVNKPTANRESDYATLSAMVAGNKYKKSADEMAVEAQAAKAAQNKQVQDSNARYGTNYALPFVTDPKTGYLVPNTPAPTSAMYSNQAPSTPAAVSVPVPTDGFAKDAAKRNISAADVSKNQKHQIVNEDGTTTTADTRSQLAATQNIGTPYTVENPLANTGIASANGITIVPPISSETTPSNGGIASTINQPPERGRDLTKPGEAEKSNEDISKLLKNFGVTDITAPDYKSKAATREEQIEANWKKEQDMQGLDRLIANLSAFASSSPTSGFAGAAAAGAQAAQALSRTQQALNDQRAKTAQEFWEKDDAAKQAFSMNKLGLARQFESERNQAADKFTELGFEQQKVQARKDEVANQTAKVHEEAAQYAFERNVKFPSEQSIKKQEIAIQRLRANTDSQMADIAKGNLELNKNIRTDQVTDKNINNFAKALENDKEVQDIVKSIEGLDLSNPMDYENYRSKMARKYSIQQRYSQQFGVPVGPLNIDPPLPKTVKGGWFSNDKMEYDPLLQKYVKDSNPVAPPTTLPKGWSVKQN